MNAGRDTRPWRGFPTAAHAKLWVGEDDSLRNALRLYHPYSVPGRLITTLLRHSPDSLSRHLFRMRPDYALANELTELRAGIRTTLDCPQAAVSFSTGTAGRHRKLTAQVTQGSHVVAYVKVGRGETVSSLLSQEAGMLQAMQRRQLRSAIIPSVLATQFRKDRTLLFLSAPPTKGAPAPLALSKEDINWLAELSALHPSSVSVDQYWARISLDAFLAGLERHHADVIRKAAEHVERVFGKRGIRFSVSHGDYTPWNTTILPGGALYVFDWEYGQMEAPLCTDLFHRLFMPYRMVNRTPAPRTILHLLQVAQHPGIGALLDGMDVSSQEIAGYLLLYLIGMTMRETAADTEPSLFVLDCIRHALRTTGDPTHRHRVLVAAYACEPDEGSEPGVGWQMCQAITQVHEAWVITRSNNRPRIEQALAVAPNPRLHFIYTDLPSWLSFWKRKQRGIRLYYYLWQWTAWRKARAIGRRIDFDVAHHVTFVNDWLFTFLALLPYPYVWGPIGSHPKAPSGLTSTWKALVADRLRCAFQTAMRIVDPFFWLSAARASVIVGIHGSVGDRFPLSWFKADKFMTHPAIGVESVDQSPPRCASDGIFHILSMGRLVPIKAFHLAIKAFAILSRTHGTARLVVVGRGPERHRLEDLTAALGIRDRVSFMEWLPRVQALEEMRKADLFLFPSFEGGGMVVLEALAHGVPVVGLQYGGPGEMVTADCGRMVPIGGQEQTVEALAAAMDHLVRNPQARAATRSAAMRRIAERYAWTNRKDVIRQWYDLCTLRGVLGAHDTGGFAAKRWAWKSRVLSSLARLGMYLLLAVPSSSLADVTEHEILQRYRSVAGSYPFTSATTRAEFHDGQAGWTILGASQKKGPPHGIPSKWSVGPQPYQLLTVDEPISDTYILPDSDPVPNSLERMSLDITAAQGETEPASFVLRSGDHALEQVRITTSALTRQGGYEQILSQHIDIRLVKVWYQASDSIHRLHGGGKTLVPELLLHDADLVRVNHEQQVNLVRNAGALIDAEQIRPFSVPARSNQQVWMTIAIPTDIPAGLYAGIVELTGRSDGKPFSARMPLGVRVLPFRLSSPPLEYALYYLAWFNPGEPSLDARAKTRAQLRAEFEDMHAHGLTNVAIDHNYVRDPDFLTFTETLRQMRAADFLTKTLLYVDWQVHHARDSAPYSRKLTSLARTGLAEGFSRVLVYNLDEKDSQTLLKNRSSFDIAHRLGMQNFVAFNSGHLAALKGLLDVAVLPRGTAANVRIAKVAGMTPWAYGDPQAGEEKPFTYRDRYGFRLWLDGFDGACDYAYQTASFGWDDWADPKWRPHNMTYPTLSKPIPTLQWEGFREAIDDVRYLATAIAPERRQQAHTAEDRRRLFAQEMGSYFTSPAKVRGRLIELLIVPSAREAPLGGRSTRPD